MKKYLFTVLFCAGIISGLFMSCKKIQTPQAEIERKEWIAGFTDSIEFYQQKKNEAETKLESLNSRISALLENFELVKNPREVSGYYLLKGWNKKIPFTSTGVYARLNENEKIEIIATLGGHTFNRIGVGTGSAVVFSEAVPHDQAFNYRHERYNTVYFSGGKADTVAQYIADNRGSKINIEFLEGSKKYPFILPADEKEMITKTWDLHAAQLEARQLQKELFISSKKIDTFRRIMDMQNLEEK